MLSFRVRHTHMRTRACVFQLKVGLPLSELSVSTRKWTVFVACVCVWVCVPVDYPEWLKLQWRGCEMQASVSHTHTRPLRHVSPFPVVTVKFAGHLLIFAINMLTCTYKRMYCRTSLTVVNSMQIQCTNLNTPTHTNTHTLVCLLKCVWMRFVWHWVAENASYATSAWVQQKIYVHVASKGLHRILWRKSLYLKKKIFLGKIFNFC